MQANVPMTLETERRKENRKRPPSLVYVELASANGGMMRDICEDGFAVRAMMPLRIGDSTPFAFSVDASTRFEGSCRGVMGGGRGACCWPEIHESLAATIATGARVAL